MPINKQEFENGKLHSRLEDEILSFLDERKGRAFTSQEIMEGIRYHTEFSTPEISKMSTFAIADFTAFLQHLIEKGKITMKIVRGRMYIIAAGDNLAKCPKCGNEIGPKKTWKMAGRPNRKGEKTQLLIGLFQCPKHGVFRAVLNKERIRVRSSAKRRKTTAPRKKLTRKKKTAGKKKRVKGKKSAVWKLV
ncbi:MAG: hypothetical protein JSW72_06390 [Candidatus Bathyarchaeota archaeon]|nr:MAG: hypothetical protein JSW72_06390 [Candidatus Bathyarchaeota archaeon]